MGNWIREVRAGRARKVLPLLLGLALALLAGCASTSEELQTLRADPLAQIEIDSGAEFNLLETQNGTNLRRSRAAELTRSFRPSDGSSEQDVLDELAEAAGRDGWRIEMADGMYDGRRFAEDAELELRLRIVPDGGVVLSLEHPG